MPREERLDWVFFNGKIITLDAEDTIGQAVAIKNNRIVAVAKGPGEEEKWISVNGVRRFDLRGKTLLPGLIDPHTHLGMATLSFRYYVDGRCPPNRSIHDILERIRQRTQETPKGGWIIVHASMFGDQKLREKRYPTKEELDRVAPEHPVALLSSVHARIVNTCALRSAGITGTTPEPPGGHIEKDPNTGNPTGVLRECNQILPIPPFTYEQVKETLQEMIAEYWVKQGYTSVSSFADALEFRVYQELLKEGRLPVRVQSMIMNLFNRPEIQESLARLGILPGFGNDRLKMGGVKIFVDGAFMGLSAATHDPYLNMPTGDYRGLLKFQDPGVLNDLVLAGHEAGLQLCVHAIGDKAQDLALDAYEYALKRSPKPHRHRLEHFGNELTSRERIRRAKEMDLIPVPSIEWLFAYGDFIEPYLGPARRDQSFLLRSMIDAGLKPANCSDTCGTEPLSVNPFFSIWCAVTRQTFFGKKLLPEEGISVREALRMYTTHAAYSGFEEDQKGSIEAGKFADLIVIDRDILTIPEEQIKNIRVEMTMIDGRIVYQR